MTQRIPSAVTASCLKLTHLVLFLCFTTAIGALDGRHSARDFGHEEQALFSLVQDGIVEDQTPVITNSVSNLLEALDVMQEQYFEIWLGTWPSSIEWTAAVLGTHISATLSTLSTAASSIVPPETVTLSTHIAHENVINEYFSQLVGSYFGQDAFRLRNEAYDDMLWVVLGWLESIKFIQKHSGLHYQHISDSTTTTKHMTWYGKQWIPSFAHRARLFWDLATKGWDTKLCGGGMIWSPYLVPYKNAITNQLYITASIGMYLHFPGDENTSPFSTDNPVGPRDPKYLAAAIEAYRWLKSSNMTNDKGLYVDGYHISGWERHPRRPNQNTQCDDRNEMVYTYNQGVLLSGQRDLWEATGASSYLEDGHLLVSNVINATGYNLKHNQIYDDEKDKHLYPHLAKWHGIGRLGILEEACDALGYCSQDGQTFKGIFFHHLTLFCAPLPPHVFEHGNVQEYLEIKSWHEKSCARYGKWIRRNAEAAMSTKDEEGKFGTWWGAPSGEKANVSKPQSELPKQAVDYRNNGIPKDKKWRDSKCTTWPCQDSTMLERLPATLATCQKDVNDRGRGRTVETQGGGVAVLRALRELVEIPAAEDK